MASTDQLDLISKYIGAASNVSDRSVRLAYLAEARLLAARTGTRLAELERVLAAMERDVARQPAEASTAS